jgi:hypothetical protein
MDPTRVKPLSELNSKARMDPTRVETLSELHSKGRLQALPTDTRLGWKLLTLFFFTTLNHLRGQKVL